MSATGQTPLFDAEGLASDFEVTMRDSPIARPARVGFLAGILAIWVYDGKPTDAQKERLKDVARRALAEASLE